MKYRAVKTVIDGYKFDSKLEAKRYQELNMLFQRGLITELSLQPRFELQPKFEKFGVKYRKIEYVADFMYRDAYLETVIEDSKGFKTPMYQLKKKLFEYTYPKLTIREIN